MSSFPATWIHGSANCAANTDPAIQVHAFDPQTFILRQNKCHTFEAPFLYLLVGTTKALLLDSGGQPNPGQALPIRTTIDGLVPAGRQLIVAHTHGHGDHFFGDAQFAGRPNTTIVPPTVAGVRNFFGFPNWPDGTASLDLGGRVLIVVPIPGHESSHIAVYDESREIMLTGDTLYPGLLVINDWPAYRQSAARLTAAAAGWKISHVLGAHIEMKKTAGQLYPIGTTFQPDEHVLQLTRAHLTEWGDDVRALGDDPRQVVRDSYILEPNLP